LAISGTYSAIRHAYQMRKIFPQWDSNIPRLGLKYSHVGTKVFPYYVSSG